MNLKGKTILVTGSARRIGRVLALAVAKAGGDVIVHHNNSPDEAEITKQEISALGQEATILQADFSDPKSTDEFIREAFSSRKLDGLVNNASVFSNLSWVDTQLTQWNNHLSINLTAPFLLSQAFGKNISNDLDGRIVNILDWRALRPGYDHFPYTISKSALVALTQTLALSLAPNIQVNGIALGAILPPVDGAEEKGIISKVPAGRWANISELSDAYLFLLQGPEYITGEIIHLDGGRHLV